LRLKLSRQYFMHFKLEKHTNQTFMAILEVVCYASSTNSTNTLWPLANKS
jgi:hypothetical protein